MIYETNFLHALSVLIIWKASPGEGGRVITAFLKIFVKTEDWKTLKVLYVKRDDFKLTGLKTEDLAIRPEDWRFEFLAGKIWL